MTKISEKELFEEFSRMGVCSGDTILLRASLGAVGRITGGADVFIDALLNAVGPEGTIVSLAFTDGVFIRKPKVEDAFDLQKKSYAGALPNAMIKRADAFRSRHPMCSYVAIGKLAEHITNGHDEKSPAYEPIRKIIDAHGKCMLVGCVGSSPGFTTTHLAEADLGLLSLAVFPRLVSTYYKDASNEVKLFRRPDSGLCSNSFYKFYSLYVKNQILTTGFIGNAYSIIAPAKECYEIDYAALKQDRKMNICGSSDCYTCNVGRWDRIYRAPGYFFKLIVRKLRAKLF
ncbi:AAC(3) family N-acetyltransferase [Pseudomonas sp. NFIX28]|uniref:AAC(3) family N-acetyltransferase n=1 Tax=Pseudomonas sp. NFIX28 TaxID=1566235 RepID=UPI00089C9605|nr:AAC(3) family N-acetyltransferase [Pseudomonas sp. NFIX28]SDZ29329.1 Aminoglycoside N3'-acetyltransferase [Pseudomonas sp. NFIX28]